MRKRGNIIRCYPRLIERVFMISAITLAKYVVNKCIEDNNPITNLQLQYILYCIQKVYLHRNNQAVFREEIAAIDEGVIVSVVYYSFQYYANNPITDRCEDILLVNSKNKGIIDRIINEKRKLSYEEIMQTIRKRNSTWSKV